MGLGYWLQHYQTLPPLTNANNPEEKQEYGTTKVPTGKVPRKVPDKTKCVGFGHAGAGGSIGLAVRLPGGGGDLSFAMTVSRMQQDSFPRRRIFAEVCKAFGLECRSENMVVTTS